MQLKGTWNVIRGKSAFRFEHCFVSEFNETIYLHIVGFWIYWECKILVPVASLDPVGTRHTEQHNIYLLTTLARRLEVNLGLQYKTSPFRSVISPAVVGGNDFFRPGPSSDTYLNITPYNIKFFCFISSLNLRMLTKTNTRMCTM